MTLEDEPPPELGKEVKVYETGQKHRKRLLQPLPTITDIRCYAQRSLSSLHPQQRQLDEPRPYRVAVSEKLHGLLSALRRSSRHLQ
ncbi:unnamed protein product [Ranitomeya imitator]|uniref:Nicotinate phosphoribosyltransferase C-terminal domain-containing protein n=1 Tax=Ranitomeya imitator TaxID=111125 RepID=A0ABN9KYP9_9NEOB|nr:unnamed protein product [Ranitomeya imitator]